MSKLDLLEVAAFFGFLMWGLGGRLKCWSETSDFESIIAWTVTNRPKIVNTSGGKMLTWGDDCDYPPRRHVMLNKNSYITAIRKAMSEEG